MCYCVNTSKQSSLKCCKEKQEYTSSKTKDVIAVHSLYNKYPPFPSLLRLLQSTYSSAQPWSDLHLQISAMQPNISVFCKAIQLEETENLIKAVPKKKK